jgi:hypothetical protein
MTGATWLVLALTAAIYVLDVLPRYRRRAEVPTLRPEPEPENAAEVAILYEDDIQELAEIGGCMIEGRHDSARLRFENWLEGYEPAWRELR